MMTTERITWGSCPCHERPAALRSAWTGGGARPHTNLLYTNLADGRELHAERIRERRHAAKEKRRKRERRAGTPGAPSLIVSGATVAVGPEVAREGSTALAGRCAAPPRAG